MRRIVVSLLLAAAALVVAQAAEEPKKPVTITAQPATLQISLPTVWKAGVATVKITPSESMWMAGYSARKNPRRASFRTCTPRPWPSRIASRPGW